MTISDNVKEKVLGTWLAPIRRWGIEGVLDRTLHPVIQEYRNQTVFPSKTKLFRAFIECPYDSVRIVFVGQDPYHDGSATGLCFANENEDPDIMSPSLRVIKREWEENDTSGVFDPSLINWAHQGILMLNTALTVEQGEPKSHSDLWEHWTSSFFAQLSREKPDLLYILFGKKAQGWKNHIVHGHSLNVVHPAAETYSNGNSGFYGCKFFDKINMQLLKLGKDPILW